MPTTIKFRAYSEKYGKMVYPNDPEYRIEIGNDDVHRVWKGEGDDEGVVVMLFTGRIDKNGKDIYAGDIVSYSWQRGKTKRGVSRAIITWDGICFSVSRNDTIFHDWAVIRNQKFEVIGNIHENPELIEN